MDIAAGAGSAEAEWRDFWSGHSVASEIAMADCYGLRHVLLKFLPRHGIVIEAGCGLGRYVFYLRGLGLRVIGCDRQAAALGAARQWALRARPECASAFSAADVCGLPLRDQSVAAYVSLGVVEHFPEGPDAALREAYRCLQPGGVAIVEVPNALAFDALVHRGKRTVGRLLGRGRRQCQALLEEPLAPAALGAALRRAGFALLFCDAVDLIYPAWSLGLGSRWYSALHRAERTRWRRLGGLAVAVGIKIGATMACFMCGRLVPEKAACGETAASDTAPTAVPLCRLCNVKLPIEVLDTYTPEGIGTAQWQDLECAAAPAGGACAFCGREAEPDEHFGDWGFSLPVCRFCVSQPLNNLILVQRALKRVWRPRLGAAA
ncbi:MAG: class I SAM-dependent methyltransferase [Deltaproteobacteria bacterium]|nr:class I SAM-dependent methyltransferase [Deltaproteobacteria bacterium]